MRVIAGDSGGVQGMGASDCGEFWAISGSPFDCGDFGRLAAARFDCGDSGRLAGARWIVGVLVGGWIRGVDGRDAALGSEGGLVELS